MNELDLYIQNLAINNFAAFVALVGKEELISAKVTILKNQGKSWAQISTKLNITVAKARSAYKKPVKIEQTIQT